MTCQCLSASYLLAPRKVGHVVSLDSRTPWKTSPWSVASPRGRGMLRGWLCSLFPSLQPSPTLEGNKGVFNSRDLVC